MGDATIAVIGGGNMARAIIEGSLRAGGPGPSQWVVAEPDGAPRAWFEARGIPTVETGAALGAHFGPETQILLAVKPQSLETVGRECSGLPWSGRIVITILAGTPSRIVRLALGGSEPRGPRIVRAMPNLPAAIGEGTTAVALGEGARPGDDALALRLFGAIGPVVEQIDERLMDAFTAVAGSGPAYLFYLAEAMVRSAIALGIEPTAAGRVVRQTLAGASLLARSTSDAPASLRKQVTSRGGTTEAAVDVMDAAGVMCAIERAVVAAEQRGRALAQRGLQA